MGNAPPTSDHTRLSNPSQNQYGGDERLSLNPTSNTSNSNINTNNNNNNNNNTTTSSSQRTIYNPQNDAQATSLLTDFPHFILERKYSNARGRFSSSYRIRHVHSSAVCVVKTITIKVLIDDDEENGSGDTSDGGSSTGDAGVKSGSSSNTATNNNTGDTTTESSSTLSSTRTTSTTANNSQLKKREYGTMTQSELFLQERELQELLSKWHHHPNILPYYAWFLGNEVTRSLNGGSVGNGMPYSIPINTSTNEEVHQDSDTPDESTKKKSKSHQRRPRYQYPPISSTTQIPNPSSTPTNPTTQSPPPPPPNPEEDQSIYLLRPHINSTLSQRIHQRPFLDGAEKMFIAFQILRAIADLHGGLYWYEGEEGRNDEDRATDEIEDGNSAGGMVLGHLHCDNIGLTSWNWVLLLDVLPVGTTACSPTMNVSSTNNSTIPSDDNYPEDETPTPSSVQQDNQEEFHSGGLRPVVIPDDDPSDWIYYFQERSGNSAGSNKSNTGANSGNGGDSSGGRTDGSFVGADDVGGTNNSMAGTNSANVTNNSYRISGGEKRCYLAPERFVTSSTNKVPCKLTPAMDIFSLGCVLIELFLNGEPAFDLGDLMEYKRRGSIATHSSLPHKLNKIESGSMRAACRHMLHLDPMRRLSAKEYLQRLMYPSPSASTNISANRDTRTNRNNYKEAANIPSPIPSCHETIFYPLFATVRRQVLSPDARIVLAAMYYGRVLRETVGVVDEWGEGYFRSILSSSMVDYDVATGVNCKNSSKDGNLYVNKNSNTDYDKHSKASEFVDNLDRYADLNTANKGGSREDGNQKCSVGKISPCPFGFCNPYKTNEEEKGDALLAETEHLLRQIEMSAIFSDDEETLISTDDEETVTKKDSKLPILPYSPYNFTPGAFHETKQTPPSAALIIFVQFILSTIRYAQRPTSKTVGLQLLLQLAKFSSDEVRLQRIVPTMVSLLQDIDATVRSMAISSLTKVLSIIEKFPPSDSQIFPKYIFQRVSHLISDPVLSVRVSFAESIALLAETGLRFLDTCHVIKLYEATDGDGDDSEEEEQEDAIDKAMESAGSAFDDDVTNLLGDATSNTSGAKVKSKSNSQKKGAKAKRDDKNATTLIRSDYDKELSELHTVVARWVVSITTDTSDHSSSLKHGLLTDIARLCNFFGKEGVMACILPQVLAFLNHRKDWQLRAALCEHIPSICAIVGRAATEQFVVPCIEDMLIDEEDMVVSSALHCIATLLEMGLLTRAVLLGAGTMSKRKQNARRDVLKTEDEKPRTEGQRKPKQGIIDKYSSLLIHPSGDIRQNAVFLYTACCRCVGYPDDEVFVLPMIRPFMRHDIGRSSLKSIKGFRSCLMPPLTRKEFNCELKKPLWTAVQIGQEEMVSAEPEDTPTLMNYLRSYHSDEALCTEYIQNLEVYLSMLRRKMKSNESQDQEEVTNMRIIRNDIQYVGKSVYSCYVPNQMYAELLTDSLPAWYDEIRQMSSSNESLASEVSSLRSMKALSNVYGLNIVQPTNSNEPQRRWKGDGMFDTIFDSSIPTIKDGKIDNALSYLSSPLSQSYGAAINGQWGALSLIDPALAEMSNHVSKLVCLDVPSIPPQLGSLCDEEGRSYTCPGPAVASTKDTNNEDTVRSAHWTPGIDTLACSSPPNEHSGPVTRLTVSQDQAYFISGSHDGTCKIWEMRQVDNSAGDLNSSLTYNGHNKSSQLSHSFIRVNDVSIIENSHSVASAGSDGSVHVWRVDMVSRESPKPSGSTTSSSTTTTSNTNSISSRVSGSTMLRKIEPSEGEVLCVSHFNTQASSIVTFATQRGMIHSWDLRCSREPFAMSVNPELGHLTSMAVGNDRNWMVAGTNRGFLSLFDVRFHKMVKLYQHESGAPINRLGTSTAALPNDNEPHPYVVMGCGLNETSVFDVVRGSCSHCFRVLDSSLNYLDHTTLPPKAVAMPILNEIPITSDMRRRFHGVGINNMGTDQLCPPTPSIQCFSGRIGTVGQNYLITGDSDGYLRYWSFSSASRSFTISPVTQPRAVYEQVKTAGNLFLCREMPQLKLNEVSSLKVPKMMQRGLTRPENGHKDAILDIKKIVYPTKGLLTCSRDGMIKFWK